MNISTKGRYGLRFIADIACYGTPTKSVSLKEASKRQEISEKYLWQVAHQLKQAGLISAERGPRGGYRLARPAGEISVRDILDALEGEVRLVECTLRSCPRTGSCSTRPIWQELEKKLNEAMDSIRLDQVAARCQSMSETAWDYVI